MKLTRALLVAVACLCNSANAGGPEEDRLMLEKLAAMDREFDRIVRHDEQQDATIEALQRAAAKNLTVEQVIDIVERVLAAGAYVEHDRRREELIRLVLDAICKLKSDCQTRERIEAIEERAREIARDQEALKRKQNELDELIRSGRLMQPRYVPEPTPADPRLDPEYRDPRPNLPSTVIYYREVWRGRMDHFFDKESMVPPGVVMIGKCVDFQLATGEWYHGDLYRDKHGRIALARHVKTER